jgi:pimeloyl-ACP methyl ester carboxylesterase
VQVLGDTVAFANSARVWRLFLEEIRTVVNGQGKKDEHVPVPDVDEEYDAIFGRYVWTNTPLWGKSRGFCEYAGSGPEHVLFLHTAGSDSRQYHALMNERHLRQRCTMYTFDLPGHGRSDLGTRQQIGDFKCDEEAYVDTIKQAIQRLKLHRPIVCGASMPGQVSLAVALRASELAVSGVISCEACEHLSRYPAIYGYSDIAKSILNPEAVCGMMSPTAPAANKRLVWWSYSSQGTGVLKGDLTFYFQGWDGRGRMEQIDTKVCPVYMLTGEYDYSCTPAVSKATADQIPGAIFETMEGLGHFPATENPTQFLPYLIKALDHIEASHKGVQAH